MPLEPHTPDSGEEERMICTSCLHPNNPDIKYCQNCGAPLGSTAAWGPWEQTQAEGFAIRQATTADRPRFIMVVGIWILFFPMAVGCGLILFAMIRNTNWEVGDKLMMVVGLGYLSLCIALLYRSTANYLRHKSGQTNDMPPSES